MVKRFDAISDDKLMVLEESCLVPKGVRYISDSPFLSWGLFSVLSSVCASSVLML